MCCKEATVAFELVYYNLDFNSLKNNIWGLRGCVGKVVKQEREFFREQLHSSLSGCKVHMNDTLSVMC